MLAKKLTTALAVAGLLSTTALSTPSWSQNINSTGTGSATSGSQSGSASTATGIQNGGNSQNGNVNSNTNARSSANTRSGASSAATGNQNANRANNSTYAGVNVYNGGGYSGDPSGGGGGGDPTIHNWSNSTNWNGGDQTIRTTPTVYAPPVSGGNPCTLAVSGGVSVIGWGAAAGGTFVDEDCADRQKIAMVWNAGYKEAAKELMCNDKKTYYAFRAVGQPCAFRQNFEGTAAPAPVASAVPVAAPVVPVAAPAPQPVAQKPLVRCNPARGIVDNCYSG